MAVLRGGLAAPAACLVTAAFASGAALTACALFPSFDGFEGDGPVDAARDGDDPNTDAACEGPAPDPMALSDAIHLAVGNGFVCAVRAGGSVVCWGQFYRAQFGFVPDGGVGTKTDNVNKPMPVAGLSRIKAIAAGDSHVCAIDEDAHVWCWGWNSQGQLGNGKVSPSRGGAKVGDDTVIDWDPTPSIVRAKTGDRLERAIAIGAGLNHSCAVVEGGVVACWGDNSRGQLGTPGGLDDAGLHRIETEATSNGIALGGAVGVSAGVEYSCAAIRGAPSSVRCVGSNGSGQLGATPPDSGVAVTMPLPPNATDPVAVHASFYESPHTVVLDGSGNVFGTGNNPHGALGAFGGGAPAAVPGLSSANVRAIATGPTHTCAILRNGWVQCIGANDIGQLGRGYRSPSEADPASTIVPLDPASADDAGTPPTDAAPLENVVEVSVGFASTCAIVRNACRQDGTVYCWGQNYLGQLGDGTRANHERPVRVVAP